MKIIKKIKALSKKTPKPDWVECYKCIYRDECETREMRDGCYLGEEERK